MQVNLSSVDNNYSIQRKNGPNFGKSSVDVLDLLTPKEQKLAKTLENVKNFVKGEAGTIAITSVGTGVVAPLVIGTNPLVKAPKGASQEEKDEVRKTKWYTAMRQPISAFTAFGIQFGVQPLLDRFTEKRCNDPNKSSKMWRILDRSILQQEKYIIRDLKNNPLKQKAIYDLAVTLKKIDPNEVVNMSASDLNKKLAEFVRNQQENLLVKDILENGTIKYVNRAEKDRFVESKTIAEIINKDLIDKNIEYLQGLETNATGIEYYKGRANKIMSNQELINKIFGSDKILDKDANLEKMLTFLNEQKTLNSSNKDLVELIDEMIKLNDKERIASRCKRTIERIDFIKDAIGNKYYNILGANEITKATKKEDILEYLKNQKVANKDNKVFEDLMDELIKLDDKDKIQKRCAEILKNKEFKYTDAAYQSYYEARNSALKMKLDKLSSLKFELEKGKLSPKDILNKIDELADALVVGSNPGTEKFEKAIFNGIEVVGENKASVKDKIGKGIIKAYQKVVDNHYQCFNQIFKVATGVFITLPISCTVLNWIYPRLMAAFFPNLAGIKKEDK